MLVFLFPKWLTPKNEDVSAFTDSSGYFKITYKPDNKNYGITINRYYADYTGIYS